MVITTSQRRKLFCLGGIVLLIALVVPLQHELTYKQGPETEGGYGLGEATLGDVDPSGAAMNLVLVGFRGIAANLLWSQALDFQKTHDWPHLKTSVDSIVLLQPHFVDVWRFQGWNMAFNVVAEYDNAQDKYDWIKAGVNFLKEGVRRNQTSVELMWATGYLYHQKLGRSDEAPVTRKLFDQDEDRDFNSRQTDRWDNFLEAHNWFELATKTVQRYGRIARNMHPALFATYPSHAKTQHAVALENDGLFGEVAREAWNDAFNKWTELGVTQEHKVNELVSVRLLYAAEDLQALSDAHRHWYDRYRWMTYYPYWYDRADLERLPETIEARQDKWLGDRALREGDLPKARELYEKSLALWKEILDLRQPPPNQDRLRYQVFANDQNTKDDTFFIVARYLDILAQLGAPKPDNVPFEDQLEERKQQDARAREARGATRQRVLESLKAGGVEHEDPTPPERRRRRKQAAADAEQKTSKPAGDQKTSEPPADPKPSKTPAQQKPSKTAGEPQP